MRLDELEKAQNASLKPSTVSIDPHPLLHLWCAYLPVRAAQCGPQNLNTEGRHLVQNGSHTYFATNWHLS